MADAMDTDRPSGGGGDGGVEQRKGSGFGGDGSHPLASSRLGGDPAMGMPAKSIQGWVVVVTGVHEEAEDEDVHETFAEFGEIKNIHLNPDRRTGFVKGYAFIEYAAKEEAEEAIAKMDGKTLLDSPIHVSWCFSKGPIKH